MTILVTGAAGQLASDLIPLLGDDVYPVDRSQFPLNDDDAMRRQLDRIRPSIVVNCAAYNLVDQAEAEPEIAFRVNGLGPRTIARWCQDNGAYCVHVSSDYVFGRDTSRDRPYEENDAVGPVSSYGVSKLAGEQFVLAECDASAVLRTCGLYGAGGKNFVNTMLRLAEARDVVNVVSDQRCTPTATADLASWIVQLLSARPRGLLHATHAGETTWAEFANEIFHTAGVSTRVCPITSAEFGAAARRPGYSVLSCKRLDSILDRPRDSWRTGLGRFLRQSPLARESADNR